MDTQGLKDKILRLAIQGKLVEQDKNDETAAVLIERIKKERDKLVKEGKIKKPKKLPPIEEEEKPFDIPEGWEWVRLGEVGLTHTGTTPSTKQEKYYGGDIPFVKPNDIYLNKINYDTQLKLTEEGVNKGRLANKYSILMVCIGTIGKAYITDKVCSFNQQINSLSPYMNKITHSKNLLYFMQSKYFQDKLWELSSATTIPILNKSKWESTLIPLPPLLEQKRIVEKVDELFALIDELDSNKEDLFEVINLTRNQVLQEAIQGELVEQNPEDEPASVLIQRIKKERGKLVKEGKIKKPKKLPPIEEEEKPFDIPEGWEWVRLGDIINLIYGGGTPDKTNPMFWNGNIKWTSVKDFGDSDMYLNDTIDSITEEGLNKSSSKIVKRGDFIISTRMGLGRIVISNIDVAINQDLKGVVLSNFFIKKLFYYFYKSLEIKGIGTTVKGIKQDELLNILIPLPPLAEQKRIVEKVDIIMNLLDELEKTMTE